MTAKILIAEGIVLQSRLMASVLEDLGYEVTIARDGWEACEKSVREIFALVLMDMDLADLGGLEATKIIRANEGAGLRVPIFALTADDDEAMRKKCGDIGIDGFVKKPVGPSALRDAVQKALAMNSRWVA